MIAVCDGPDSRKSARQCEISECRTRPIPVAEDSCAIPDDAEMLNSNDFPLFRLFIDARGKAD